MRAAIPVLLLVLSAPLQLGCAAKQPSAARLQFAQPGSGGKGTDGAGLSAAAAAKRDPLQRLRDALNVATRKGKPVLREQGSVATTGDVAPPPAQSGIGTGGWWSVTSVPAAASVPVATGGLSAPEPTVPRRGSTRPRNVLIGSALVGGIFLLYAVIRRHDPV